MEQKVRTFYRTSLYHSDGTKREEFHSEDYQCPELKDEEECEKFSLTEEQL